MKEDAATPLQLKLVLRDPGSCLRYALIMHMKFSATTSGRATETANIIKEVSGPELALMPVFLGLDSGKAMLDKPLRNRGSQNMAYRKGT